MKTIMIKTKNAVVTLLCAAALAGLWACEADPVETGRGSLPDKEPLENTYAMIRSERSPVFRAVAHLVEGTSTVTDQIYCRLTQPAEKAVTLKVEADEALVKEYNDKYGTEFPSMSSGNVNIEANGLLSVAEGERVSGKLKVTFKADGLAPGTYLVPVVISSNEVKISQENGVVYYGVKVRGREVIDYELDTDYVTVFYVNTTKYQPLLADIWDLQKDLYDPEYTTLWRRTYGNIVNLRVVQISYDAATGRAMLVLNSDMRYVLEHADKYIRPLQDKGRKVCLCLEGGSTGLGFCNLTDEQIADFTGQVKACVEEYALDGVNFFDRNAGYGMEGTESMPETNTTSYPKLIKAMRDALGTGKLVTVADYEKPTEYFWDTEATGGIAVGDYLDYAWSGYMDEREEVKLVDPYTDSETAMMFGIQLFERKAFAGLPKERFGCVAVPWYPVTSELMNNMFGLMNVGMWAVNPDPVFRNNIAVFDDLIPNLQGSYEGSWNVIPSMFWSMFGEDAMMGTAGYTVLLRYHSKQFDTIVDVFDDYNAFAKDW